MLRYRQWWSVALVLAVVGCDTATEPVPIDENSLHRFHAKPRLSSTRGHGTHQISETLIVDFAHHALSLPNGRALGWFFQSVMLNGQLIEFLGKVTCVTFDADEGRAWVGGIVLRNNSEHPDFMTEINEPGRDVWFRVLDTGHGAADPDRATFLGFEGGAGIITSAEYCDTQPWPDNNERTNPVTDGRIVNRAR
jgi:hypothetical protein